ncbi:glycosyltransferase family 39 protein [Rhodococcus fascians]|uniref:glycosyltransferase family 39 protein n=1 Tax=Rhodococcoides fascians TaxID=1828 RepID=UPI0019575DEE|nr:glycosyltransferase family 39 protein [Rhodococcus fascians]MBM7242050.1 glycosyltransferase family 39 protein [Rhodococcus fascians]MBY3808754.1 glycosyltransferase family 39 protein [Rhodococcus fascians]MBY3840198.1 glycosyltransferase family 39 protein [Rhodococcus fascians]MBY3845037.1 glycosyltransferase family 39 protein [Rhodococcus fascians]MBY3848601.1 glycosyltransferase family 39 protein [Rhodococcus fascians]
MTTTIERPSAAAPTEPATSRRWELLGLITLLIGTGVAYIWGLGASGWANSFYSAAIQAGSVSWKAFFFGSSDAANSITVDKPPMSLWLMSLSVRVFGLNTWAMLVPQALLGVASVALLRAVVVRRFGAAAGLLAGLVLALTPVAALMFRFNNPDALLVLLMIAAVWAMLRGVESGKTKWLLITGMFVGFGFLTKQLQVMLVVPPLALTYLIAGPPKLGTRVLQLFAALGAMIVSAGWWLLIVEFWPASSRPWVGGSQNNSILELTLGYNGLGRLSGNETGSVTPGGGGGGGSMWGETGILRMFDASQGGQIAWLIPAALLLLVTGLVLRGKAPRTDAQRASLIVWGAWLLVTGLTFSFMAGIFHSYYTVALSPAVAALVGIGSVMLWRERQRLWVRIAMALAVASTVALAWVLLGRSASFVPWLKWAILVVGVVAVVALLIPALTRGRLAAVAILAVMFAGLAGPTAYAVDTIGTPHTGSIVSAGPNTGMRGFGGMGEGRRGQDGLPGGMQLPPGAQMPAGMQPPAGLPGQAGQLPGGAEMGMGGGMGGLLEGSTPTAEVTAMLEQDAASYTWVAAAIGANTAAGYQLATEDPVMPVGGFNGTDPSPTLAEFQQYVADGRIHYFIAGGGMGGRESGSSAEISAWVTENFTATTVDNVTLYDLTQ